jgi:hypothetical protein
MTTTSGTYVTEKHLRQSRATGSISQQQLATTVFTFIRHTLDSRANQLAIEQLIVL